MFRKILRKISIPRPPDLAVMANWAAILLACGVAGSLGFGFGSATAATPQSCTKAFTAAERAFVAYENLAYSTHLAATRGRIEFAGHEADKASARGELDDLGPVYRDAKAECVGGADS